MRFVFAYKNWYVLDLSSLRTVGYCKVKRKIVHVTYCKNMVCIRDPIYL